MNKVFDIIKAAKFFPKYAPEGKNWKHKLRGKDGNKKPIEFSKDDKQMIKQGIKSMFSELKTGSNNG